MHCGRNVKLIATLLGRLTCHPMRAHHGVSRAEFSLTEPIPLQAENRERKTVLLLENEFSEKVYPIFALGGSLRKCTV